MYLYCWVLLEFAGGEGRERVVVLCLFACNCEDQKLFLCFILHSVCVFVVWMFRFVVGVSVRRISVNYLHSPRFRLCVCVRLWWWFCCVCLCDWLCDETENIRITLTRNYTTIIAESIYTAERMWSPFNYSNIPRERPSCNSLHFYSQFFLSVCSVVLYSFCSGCFFFVGEKNIGPPVLCVYHLI